jgi:hypothetical protein
LFMFMVIAWIWRCCSVCVACGKCSIEYGGKVSSRLSRQNVVPLAGKFPLDFSGQKVVPYHRLRSLHHRHRPPPAAAPHTHHHHHRVLRIIISAPYEPNPGGSL